MDWYDGNVLQLELEKFIESKIMLSVSNVLICTFALRDSQFQWVISVSAT